MDKMKILFFLFLLSVNLFSQQIQDIYNSVLNLHDRQTNEKTSIELISEFDEPRKCGFGIISEVKYQFNQFNTNQAKIVAEILSRPDRDKNMVSPSGIFKIHYDTTGVHAPNYYPSVQNNIQLSVDSLAIALDSSYYYEIEILGYEPPPDDEGEGGDDRFDIYISNLGSGYYGYTEYDPRDDGRYKSFIVIDNKMDVPTPGINGARVTAAHEFHHAIQVGSYRPPLEGDSYYFEATSTAMEEFVYDTINDYYFYLPTYFRNPERRFTYSVGNTGYDRVIWNIYLKEKFEREDNDLTKGFDIIKKSWEIMRNHQRSAIEAISLALAENGLDMKSSYGDFGAWCYFTSYRSQSGYFFEEAENYPLVKPISYYEYQPPKKIYSMSIQPVANNYMIFDLSYLGVNDTLVSIITNGDIVSAAGDPYPSIEYTYSLMTNPEDGAVHIVNEYYSKIESDVIEYLTEVSIFNDQIVEGSTIERGELEYVYPQPYSYYKHSDISLAIPVKQSSVSNANLNIYTISMNLVYTGEHEINTGGRRLVLWDGLNNNSQKLSSGIYIYVTETDGQIQKGKLAIIND